MINITENSESYGACNSCLTKDGREVSRVEINPKPHDSTVIRLCDSCLVDLSEKLIMFIAENVKG